MKKIDENFYYFEKKDWGAIYGIFPSEIVVTLPGKNNTRTFKIYSKVIVNNYEHTSHGSVRKIGKGGKKGREGFGSIILFADKNLEISLIATFQTKELAIIHLEEFEKNISDDE